MITAPTLPACSPPAGDAATVAGNLRRLMAREGLTFEEVVAATRLDERTIRGLARAANKPHARTLHKLAAGLGVAIEELFRPLGRWSPQAFDRATNVLVEGVIAQCPEVFDDWSESDFNELYSRFGTGGALTEEGILAAAEALNAKRAMWTQISVILESGEAELLAEFVEILYWRATAVDVPRRDTR
jgi:transcriptional regulator with XRE-family HTH domain